MRHRALGFDEPPEVRLATDVIVVCVCVCVLCVFDGRCVEKRMREKFRIGMEGTLSSD